MPVEQLLHKHTQTFLAEQGADRLESMLVLAERYIVARGDLVTNKSKSTSPKKHPNAALNTKCKVKINQIDQCNGINTRHMPLV